MARNTLIEHGNGLDLTSIVTYDGGESLDLIILIEDIQIPNKSGTLATLEDIPESNDDLVLAKTCSAYKNNKTKL